MMKYLLIFVLLICNQICLSVEEQPVSFGPVVIGESRLPLKASDFNLRVNLTDKSIKSKVVLRQDSIQWVRVDDVLLTPRGRMALMLEGQAHRYSLSYRGHALTMQQKNSHAYTEFFVSLFQRDPIHIYRDGEYLGKVEFSAKEKKATDQTILIDYSCARRGIEIEGMEGEFVSLGCRIHRVGNFPKEIPMMEVIWTTANYRLMDSKGNPPYLSVFLKNDPVRVKLVGPGGKERTMTIKARLPSRMHRLNVAYGLGPYFFETTYKPKANSDKMLIETEPMAPALMLYFNFKLTDDSSIRGFDAAVWKDSAFNNAGVYFANDVAKVMDNKLTITTLIGMQYLYFNFDPDSSTINEPIFPQGLEFQLNHSFGIENYIIGGGGFFSPTDSYDYQNIWIRWGKNYFWELNYIYWGKEEFTAKMWGLSIGFLWDSYL